MCPTTPPPSPPPGGRDPDANRARPFLRFLAARLAEDMNQAGATDVSWVTVDGRADDRAAHPVFPGAAACLRLRTAGPGHRAHPDHDRDARTRAGSRGNRLGRRRCAAGSDIARGRPEDGQVPYQPDVPALHPGSPPGRAVTGPGAPGRQPAADAGVAVVPPVADRPEQMHQTGQPLRRWPPPSAN
jgi:hypothetical protein